MPASKLPYQLGQTPGIDLEQLVAALQANFDALMQMLVPIGVPVPYFGTTEPDGGAVWKFPNAQAISRRDYVECFELMGTTHGSGDGSTTFNLPDGRGRMFLFLDNLGGATDAGRLTAANVLGATGGSESIVIADLPSHAHTAGTLVTGIGTTGNDSPDHTHQQFQSTSPTGGSQIVGASAAGSGAGANGNTGGASVRHQHSIPALTVSGSTATTGSGAAGNRLPPYVLANALIRVK